MKSHSLRVDGSQVRPQLGEAAMPAPGPGQLLLKMHAAGLNRGEFIPGGLIKGSAAKPAGIEGAGEIVAIGAGAAGWLTLFGVCNKLRNADQRAAGVPAFKSELLRALADGRLQPLVDHVFAFDELPAAQARMEANQHLGKIVLRISH